MPCSLPIWSHMATAFRQKLAGARGPDAKIGHGPGSFASLFRGPCLKKSLFIGKGIDIKCRGEAPQIFLNRQKTMIAHVIIDVVDQIRIKSVIFYYAT